MPSPSLFHILPNREDRVIMRHTKFNEIAHILYRQEGTIGIYIELLDYTRIIILLIITKPLQYASLFLMRRII